MEIKLPDINARDDVNQTVRRLFDFAYKLSAKRYHSDHGGDDEVMKVINAARDLVKARFKG